jgi:hypothetical protein
MSDAAEAISVKSFFTVGLDLDFGPDPSPFGLRDPTRLTRDAAKVHGKGEGCDKLRNNLLRNRQARDHAMAYLDYHRTVIGYHGTSAAVADSLVAGEPFTHSSGDNEWLGSGIYFWEYAPKQALWWAKRFKKDSQPAVVGAMIRLGNCFDLLDQKNVDALQKAKDGMVTLMKRDNIEIPKNERIYKNLDCAVFNYFYQQVEDDGEPRIDTARAAYVPTDNKKRIWRASWIYKDTHIQICVRSSTNILAVWHAHPDGGYGKIGTHS